MPARVLTFRQRKEVKRLSRVKARKLKRLHDENSLAALAKRYGVSKSCVNNIASRRTWKCIPEGADITEDFSWVNFPAGKHILSPEDVVRIRVLHGYRMKQEKRLNDECSQAALAKRFGVSESTIERACGTIK